MTAVDTMSLGQLLRSYRRDAGLTQDQVAAHAGISVRALSDYERDARRVPHKTTLALLGDALEAPPEDRARLEAAWRRRAEARDARPGMEPPTLPLIGRERELALLERHLTGAGPPVLMFAGEPGIGKSRLLDEAAARAPGHGLRVLHGGCQRRDAEAPYAPLPDALTRYINGLSPTRRRVDLQGCAWLARLLPELADVLPAPPSAWPLPPGEERRLMSKALERARGEPPVEALAYHYGGGDVPEKAVAYLELAGDRALARYAVEAAEVYYRETARRLDWLERPRDAARVREKLGDVLRTVNKFDDALTALDAALEAYRAAGDQLGLGRVTAQIGHVHIDRGTPEGAMARVLEMLAYLEDNAAWQGLAALYMTLALFFVAGGRYQEQLFAAERAIELAHKAGDAGIAANAEAARGHALLLLGRLDEARAVMEAAVPLAEAVGDLDCLTATFGNLSALHRWRGDVAQSWRYVERSIAAAEQLGNAVLIMVAKFRRAVLALYAGDMAQAHADLDWVAPLDDRIGGAWVFAYPVIALGVTYAIEGDWKEAERYLVRGSAVAAPLGGIEAARRAQTWLAERDLYEGRPAAARDRLAHPAARPRGPAGAGRYHPAAPPGPSVPGARRGGPGCRDGDGEREPGARAGPPHRAGRRAVGAGHGRDAARAVGRGRASPAGGAGPRARYILSLRRGAHPRNVRRDASGARRDGHGAHTVGGGAGDLRPAGRVQGHQARGAGYRGPIE